MAVTAPGHDVLPWDEAHCRDLGPHRHTGHLGCRVDRYAATAWNLDASKRWRRLHRRVYQAVCREGVKPVLLARVFEKQRRGVLHVHPVLGFKTPAERHAARLYAAHLAVLAAQYGFGYTERKVESRSSKRVAGYLSSYFVTGKQAKPTLQESVAAGDMPRSIIHVSTTLTTVTGVTMRELRFRRFVWFLSERAGCCLQEAREIASRLVAGTLDLNCDSFTPSPRFLAQILGASRPAPSRRTTLRCASIRECPPSVWAA